MKYPLHLIAFLALTSLFVLLVCCKDDPEVSKPVEEKNYWSKTTCIVDGKVWGDCYPSFVKESRTNGEWYKNAIGRPLRLYFTSACDNPVTHVSLLFSNFKGIGSYVATNDTRAEYVINGPNVVIYSTNLGKKGTIVVSSFDSVKREVSGTYEFSAFNVDSNKTVTVGNGVFTKINFSIF